MTDSIHPAFAALPPPEDSCHLSVAIPVRNEEAHLRATLHALQMQCAPDGTRLNPRSYEVVLLLNCCTDGSLRVAQQVRAASPSFALHVAQWQFHGSDAHVGSARSLLLQQCAHRLQLSPRRLHNPLHAPKLLLTTDADTVVDRHWLAENTAAILRGADAVGGDILTCAEERRSLSPRARRAYVLDRRYRRAVALLESLLDPVPHDPWPRHQHHFGGSMACTLQAYQRSGGMRPVPTLEDLAFYHALLASGARFRHEPRVKVYTSARTEGRASVGMSEQLRQWDRNGRLQVCSTELLSALLKVRGSLRRAMAGGTGARAALLQAATLLQLPSTTVEHAMLQSGALDIAWTALDADRRLTSMRATGRQTGSIARELHKVQRLTAQLLHSAAAHSCDTSRADAPQRAATMAG